jgi:hypothetical protein
MVAWCAEYFKLKKLQKQQMLEKAFLNSPRNKTFTSISFPEFSFNYTLCIGRKTKICHYTWTDFVSHNCLVFRFRSHLLFQRESFIICCLFCRLSRIWSRPLDVPASPVNLPKNNLLLPQKLSTFPIVLLFYKNVVCIWVSESCWAGG